MKANELMVGDILLNENADYVLVRSVSNTAKKDFCIVEVLDGVHQGEIQRVHCEDLTPTILTPEILEKNGLWGKDPDRNPNCLIAEANTTNFNDAEGKPHSWVQIQDISSIECMRWYIKIWGKGNLGMSGYVGYVHELQHALRLCGIEKEIEL